MWLSQRNYATYRRSAVLKPQEATVACGYYMLSWCILRSRSSPCGLFYCGRKTNMFVHSLAKGRNAARRLTVVYLYTCAYCTCVLLYVRPYLSRPKDWLDLALSYSAWRYQIRFPRIVVKNAYIVSFYLFHSAPVCHISLRYFIVLALQMLRVIPGIVHAFNLIYMPLK